MRSLFFIHKCFIQCFNGNNNKPHKELKDTMNTLTSNVDDITGSLECLNEMNDKLESICTFLGI